MNEKYLQIIEHYGLNHQQRKFMEEVFELQEALILDDGSLKSLEHITEEIADCMVLLKQFQEYFEISDAKVESIKAIKLVRTLERINKNE